ncbi:MAG TPA: glucosidase [Candidatus Dormibacteraeota bacterium]
MRLAEADSGAVDWRRWGPYLAERAWGTVREDYSATGDAWGYFPHDHARSRAYRWSEDGLAGICDDQQTLCLALAVWNGRDPILKERIFGLSGPEGNHGEDAKEYWFFLDSTPTHSFMRWRYLYPRQAFPYAELIAENARRGRDDPEYELLDTGLFEGGHWEVTADIGKGSPEEIVYRVTVRNRGAGAAAIDVLPTLWFRNHWSWNPGTARPSLRLDGGALVAEHPHLGRRVLRGTGAPQALFCENETNLTRLYGVAGTTLYPKDGINDFVISGTDTVNPEQVGTKAALRYRLEVPENGSASITVRLADVDGGPLDARVSDALLDRREAEADAFYAALTPPGATAEEAMVMRQALAGMLWSKQFYFFNVQRWLDGDPSFPPPPPERRLGRNAGWHHFGAHDVLTMPDTWEYPWFAAWDTAFQCVALARVDPDFAKRQLVLLCREWYMHPNGQLPAYEWSFDDVNPPVHAWVAMRVFTIDGHRDIAFLERIFHKLLLNFTWWVNRKDTQGNNVFQGGFLGLDNIGPFDRSAQLPAGDYLEQSDATAWMAMYCLSMLEMALALAYHDPVYEDTATKFFEHFTLIATAMNSQALWDDEDGFYYDCLRLGDGSSMRLRCRSMVGLIPLFAVATLSDDLLRRLPDFAERVRWYLAHHPELTQGVAELDRTGVNRRRLLSIVGGERLARILERLCDEAEFLSDHGIRSLSSRYRDRPVTLTLDGINASVDYEPGESRSGLFGGNSNWRGPVWFPVNHLAVSALVRFHRYLGESTTVEYPTGSGRRHTLAFVAEDIARRLVSIFLDDAQGRRPVFGACERFQTDPEWHDLLPFHEYFHGDTGAGLGASHQTGWTGLVADLICSRIGLRHGGPPAAEVARSAELG